MLRKHVKSSSSHDLFGHHWVSHPTRGNTDSNAAATYVKFNGLMGQRHSTAKSLVTLVVQTLRSWSLSTGYQRSKTQCFSKSWSFNTMINKIWYYIYTYMFFCSWITLITPHLLFHLLLSKPKKLRRSMQGPLAPLPCLLAVWPPQWD